MENQFVKILDGLSMRPELVSLFQEIVLDAWKTRRGDASNYRLQLTRRTEELNRRTDMLVNAF